MLQHHFSGEISVTDLGCWKDSVEDRALESLEGKSGCDLDDDFRARTHSIAKCYACAKANGYFTFGVQYGGECWAGKDEMSYKKHGQSTACGIDGEGAMLANSVYKITDASK